MLVKTVSYDDSDIISLYCPTLKARQINYEDFAEFTATIYEQGMPHIHKVILCPQMPSANLALHHNLELPS